MKEPPHKHRLMLIDLGLHVIAFQCRICGFRRWYERSYFYRKWWG